MPEPCWAPSGDTALKGTDLHSSGLGTGLMGGSGVGMDWIALPRDVPRWP